MKLETSKLSKELQLKNISFKYEALLVLKLDTSKDVNLFEFNNRQEEKGNKYYIFLFGCVPKLGPERPRPKTAQKFYKGGPLEKYKHA